MSSPIKPFFKSPDAQLLTEAQRERMCRLLGTALTEIRALGWDGKQDQATALADAFHNVPVLIWTAHFSPNHLGRQLSEYHSRFGGSGYADYPRLLAEAVDL